LLICCLLEASLSPPPNAFPKKPLVTNLRGRRDPCCVLMAWASKGASHENHRSRIACCIGTFRVHRCARVRRGISRWVLRTRAVLRRRRALPLSQRTLSLIRSRIDEDGGAA